MSDSNAKPEPATKRAKLWCEECGRPHAHSYTGTELRETTVGVTLGVSRSMWVFIFGCDACNTQRVWGST